MTTPPPALRHLAALQTRLLRTVLVMGAVIAALYVVKEPLLTFLMQPLQALPNAPKVMVTGVPELFFIYLKVCTWGGVFVGVPWLAFELWQFVAPALYPAEKRAVWPMLVAVPLLFYAGGAFAYVFITPVALAFFFSFAQPGLVAQPTLTAYLSFLTSMSFAFGLAFNLPVVLLLLVRVGLVSLAALRRYRRFVIVLIFIIAAIFTPPDPLSQLLMAIPMVLLYEGAILLASALGWGAPQKRV